MMDGTDSNDPMKLAFENNWDVYWQHTPEQLMGDPSWCDSTWVRRFNKIDGGQHGKTAIYLGMFPSTKARKKYEAEADKIRKYIERVQKDYNEGKKSGEECKQILINEWLPMIDRFVATHGMNKVTKDIRWAGNSVREQYDLPLLAWNHLTEIRPSRKENEG